MQIFERAAQAGGQLLRVERLDVRGGGAAVDEREASAFVLTFDVGRVLVSAQAPGGPLSVLHVENAEHLPSGLEPADEAEPWWRVIGAPVTRAAHDGEHGDEERANTVTLQFRGDEDNPRRIALSVEGGRVRAGLQ